MGSQQLVLNGRMPEAAGPPRHRSAVQVIPEVAVPDSPSVHLAPGDPAAAWRRRSDDLARLMNAPAPPSSREYLVGMAVSEMSPFFRRLESPLEETSVMDGQRMVMLGANNYLGLTTDPRVVKAAVEAVETYGNG